MLASGNRRSLSTEFVISIPRKLRLLFLRAALQLLGSAYAWWRVWNGKNQHVRPEDWSTHTVVAKLLSYNESLAVDEAIATSCVSIWRYYTAAYYIGLAVFESIVFVKVMIVLFIFFKWIYSIWTHYILFGDIIQLVLY